MPTTVLLVDDQPGFVSALALTLRARGYEVFEATTVREAIDRFMTTAPDVVLLDVGLPDGSGLDVVSHIRQIAPTPILVVSAQTNDRDIVTMLDAGADGYLTKPFGLEELLARLRSVLRRQMPRQTSGLTHVVTPDFEIDLDARVVTRAQGVVHLTRTEWSLVDYLVRAAGRPVPQRELLDEIWGAGNAQNTNYIRVYLVQLRKKLEPEPSHPIYFVTEPGLGVRFDAHPLGLDAQ